MRWLLLACLLFASGRAMAEDQATLRLNWLIYGFHTPFYLGVERGLYRQNGIDLTIGEGQGSGRAVQTVAAGSDTFGLSDGSSIIAGAAKGAPVVAIMGIMNRSPYAVIVRRDSGITDIKGLAGKTIAATTGEAGLVIFPALLHANGMAPDAVRFLRVDGAAKLVAVLENRATGLLGGLENQSLILPQKGLAVTTLPYSDFGVNTIGLAIQTTRDTLSRNPDLARRFIRATRAAFEAAEKDPEASIQAGMKVKPDMDHDLSLAQLKAGLTLLRSPRGADKPIGWMAPQDWADTLQLMKQYQDLQTDQPPTAFWTDDYLPK
ncbi:MAG: ABC transporter substrate-binding protein [Acidisphaera sp.]|nr:ABC transporter substrate-binding protein [Acidisphaera sp.]